MSDSMDLDEVLIEEVREHEVLYNTRSPYYRHKNIRQSAWNEIASVLNITSFEAKERWDKLRRCYCNARNRRRSMAVEKKITWKFEHQMSFIAPYVEPRSASKYHNLIMKMKSEPEDENIMFSESDDQSREESKYIPHPLDVQKIITEDHQDQEEVIISKQMEFRNGEEDDLNLDSLDETDIFFLSMSKLVKKLPNVDQAQIKRSLKNLVKSAETKCS